MKYLITVFILFNILSHSLAQSNNLNKRRLADINDLADVSSTITAMDVIVKYHKIIADANTTSATTQLYIDRLERALVDSSSIKMGVAYNDLIPATNYGEKEREYVEIRRYLNTLSNRKVKIEFNKVSEWLYDLGETPKKERTVTVYVRKNTDFVYPESSKTRYTQSNILGLKFLLTRQDSPKLFEIKKVVNIPDNAIRLTQEEIDKIMVSQEANNFKVSVFTNKGRENIVFKEKETMILRAKVKADKLYYIRVAYKLQDGSLTLLTPAEKAYVPSPDEDMIDIGEFECSPPFGVEELMVFVSDMPFCTLNTEKRNGLIYILDDEITFTNCSRGMKPKKGATLVEDRLKITTKP